MIGFGFAVCVTPFAVWVTSHFPAFRSIPWTLPYLVVALVTEVAGIGPALIACLIAAVGIYLLVLAPGQDHFYDPIAWIKVAAFLFTASAISYLVRQRKVGASSLQSSELHYRTVTETASDVIVTINENSTILAINPSVKATLGYEPAELIGKPMFTLMPERFRASHAAGIARYLASGKRHIPWNGVQLPGLHKNGEEIPLEISFAAHSSEGKTHFTGFIRDVSERHRIQAALMQSEKLAAVGRLASSIAHEINNPLESIGNLLYLSRDCSDMPTIQNYLETAEQELRRVSVIANQTLQFHKQSNTLSQVDCARLVDNCLTLYQGKLINARISVERRHRAGNVAYCAEGEIRQVLNNLIGNAIDALPTGGRLLVRTQDATHWRSGRKGVAVTIADTGRGMGSEVRSKMFEAFFSTKGSGGAGLGLWISCQLIEKNVGHLQVKSSQRKGANGTVFTLFLPSSDQSDAPKNSYES